MLSAYVKFAPWLAIIFGVLGIHASLALFGLGAFLGPVLLLAGAEGIAAGGMAIVTGLIGLATSVLEVVGGYLMLKRRLNEWWLVALGLVLSLVTNLLSLSLLGLIITALIAYLHLQVRPRYSSLNGSTSASRSVNAPDGRTACAGLALAATLSYRPRRWLPKRPASTTRCQPAHRGLPPAPL